MKLRLPTLTASLRGARPTRLPRWTNSTLLPPATAARLAGSLSQRPDSKYIQFPGAVKSAFTASLKFEQPSSHEAMPTYRAVDQNGNVVDPSFQPDLSDDEVIKLYKHMLLVSIMDLIMFDTQRQGRISFYIVSAGEEAVSVGSASALTKDDVVFCQYREQGLFAQRGFTANDFMNQLFANRKDAGRGRSMPVHYGSKELNIVRPANERRGLGTFHADSQVAHDILHIGDANTPCFGRRLCPQDAAPAGSLHPTSSSGRLLW